MTKVTIFAGVCGFSTEVIVEKIEKKRVNIRITSQCEMVRAIGEELSQLDMMSVFKGFLDNPVYKSASRHLRHVTCPVPCGILKAVEVELGLALPRDVNISFLREDRWLS